jgi:putative nucleotidyltransferase with HDIG domain
MSAIALPGQKHFDFQPKSLGFVETMRSRTPAPAGRVPLSELLSALSLALDLLEDAKPGHAIRSCLLGMRIGHAIGLPSCDLADLYYALLLKDVGYSTNARLMCEIVGGDDRAIKREVKLEDWTRASFSAVRLMLRYPSPGGRMTERLGRLVQMGLHRDQCNAQLIRVRCERGAQIARDIGLNRQSSEAIRSLDEHWDGSGHPDQLVGENIPIMARILNVAQHLDLFAFEQGQYAALDVLLERSGRWFDPAIVRLVHTLAKQNRLWHEGEAGTERKVVHDMEPGCALRADETQIDRIAGAFAEIVNAKSPFTLQHSLGVTDAAMLIARELGLSDARRKLVYRASLLHDLGKLRVPNTILDKPGKLNAAEWSIVREHPGLTRDILARITAFREIAEVAGNHHEKLDGSGYPFQRDGSKLNLESRILTVADVYGALSEDRPYRAGLSRERIHSIMSSEIPHKLDPDCYEALVCSLDRGGPSELRCC